MAREAVPHPIVRPLEVIVRGLIILVWMVWPAGAAQVKRIDTSSLMGTPYAMTLVDAFPELTFSRPIQLLHPGDHSGRVFVLEQNGKIKVFRSKTDVTPQDVVTFLDLSSSITRQGNEEGLLGLAFHPDYKNNGRLFVDYSRDGDRASVLSEFRVSPDDANRADPESERVLLEIDQPFPNHNGGSIVFGPDGFLYIGMGDGGAAEDPHGNGQNLATLLGSVLRIDVDGTEDGKPYAIPEDNPFAGDSAPEGARPEIYAYGIRNIWRLSFDDETGKLWGADVGQYLYEEIDLLKKGGNYGWRLREGMHPFETDRTRLESGWAPLVNPGAEGKLAVAGDKLIDPIWEYPHSEGRSITGGLVYRGTKLPDLAGTYLYADYVMGSVWALHLDHENEKVIRNDLIASPQLAIAGFGEDAQGEVYLCAYDDHIYRLSRLPERLQKQFELFPRKLSQTGLFASTKEHLVADGLLPYTLNTPLWSDGANKLRYFALPQDVVRGSTDTCSTKVTFSPSGPWQFPVGTVTVKTFELEMKEGDPASRRRLETRIFVHNERGWDGYTYKWNQDQSDAELLEHAVTDRFTVRTSDGNVERTWYYPSRSDCNACHTKAAGPVLGLRTRQINRTGDGRGAAIHVNQLDWLASIDVFDGDVPDSPSQLDAFPDWADAEDLEKLTRTEIDTLARAYLDVNCAICHQPGGGGNSRANLRHDVEPWLMRVIDEPPRRFRVGESDVSLITPGEPQHSELLFRMVVLGPRRMPPLGSSKLDAKAIRLIAKWIEQLGD